MSTYAVRYSQPLLAVASGYLVPMTDASVLVRRSGVATDCYLDQDKTPAPNPVEVGTDPGEVGLDVDGNLVFWVDPGADLDYVVAIGDASVVVAIPTLSPHPDEPLPAGAVEVAVAALPAESIAQAQVSGLAAALDDKQTVIVPGTYLVPADVVDMEYSIMDLLARIEALEAGGGGLPSVVDGGAAGTPSFAATYDGGSASTSVFEFTIDGGTP